MAANGGEEAAPLAKKAKGKGKAKAKATATAATANTLNTYFGTTPSAENAATSAEPVPPGTTNGGLQLLSLIHI